MKKTYVEKTADFFGNMFNLLGLYTIYSLTDFASKYVPNIPDLPMSAIDIYNKIQPYINQLLR